MPIRLPQARSLDRLRLLLQIVDSGEGNASEVGLRMGAKPGYPERHAGYYREAAEILGFVEHKRWALTAGGLGLLATARHSAEEREILREAIAGAEQLGELRAAILGADTPDLALWIARTKELGATGSKNTIHRRVKDTLGWRRWLTEGSDQGLDRKAQRARRRRDQLELPIDDLTWPDPEKLPFNWPHRGASVEQIVYGDLDASDGALVVMGYASLLNLCDFVGSRGEAQLTKLRVAFGAEPFVGRDLPRRREERTLEGEARDYWLDRGFSILHSASVLRTIAALEGKRLETRISRRALRLHAKIFAGEHAVTIGSSNFTEPGLRDQLEANVRILEDRAPGSTFTQARRLAENYWRLSEPYDAQLLELLEQLLRKVTWQEALARACAELLEGQWAKAFLRDELGLSQRVWPSQMQGIGQALYVLMDVGSVLIADATGSGKTRAGAWLIRALRQRLVATGRPIADPVLVSPPAVAERWATELHEAEVRIEVHSQGVLSSKEATRHPRVALDVEMARILALDEAHNFIHPSNRTTLVNTNLADHTVLFTATPINRDVSDLLGIAELLGADNLDADTLAILEEAGGRSRRALTPGMMTRLKDAVRRFTVRRTKRHLNALIDREPNRYRNASGKLCRYPRHEARNYRLGESIADCRLAAEIGELARSLKGIFYFKEPIRFAKLDPSLDWTREKYLKMRLHSARALALHGVRATLRSSRAALWEHLHGTKNTLRRYDIAVSEKDDSGNVLSRLGKLRAAGPPTSDLGSLLPDWLTDPACFADACDEERACYEAIAERCERLSDGRERAKVELLRSLVRKHGLVVAFDSRPITLFLLRRMFGRVAFEIFLATGGRPGDQRRVQNSFALGASTKSALALCSNAMSEGVNLQQASAVVHLDMPSVVRIAEQRVGRIDRMDSPHADVESWWPQDADEFALASDEKLGARLKLVGEILGSNVELPEGVDSASIVGPKDMLAEMQADEERQLEVLDDAFAPVRGLIEGPDPLIDSSTYDALRKSKAKVVSAVAAVRASSAWGFFALPGTDRVAPRWIFADGSSGVVTTALDRVVECLRGRLVSVEDVELDERAVSAMRAMLAMVEESGPRLLPRRKQRALRQMREVLSAYQTRAAKNGDEDRQEVLGELLDWVNANDKVDLDELADAWLAAIRPRWREALRENKKRRRRLSRIDGLTPTLLEQELSDDELVVLRSSVRSAIPIAERVIAAIVGVPLD